MHKNNINFTDIYSYSCFLCIALYINAEMLDKICSYFVDIRFIKPSFVHTVEGIYLFMRSFE